MYADIYWIDLMVQLWDVVDNEESMVDKEQAIVTNKHSRATSCIEKVKPCYNLFYFKIQLDI